MNKLHFAGLIGSLFFWTAVVIAGMLYPNYSHVSQFISELAAQGTPSGKIMNYFGIIPFGISIFIMAASLYYRLTIGIVAKISLALLLISGVLFIMAGIFRCDEGCQFIDMSREAIIHNFSAMLAFLFGILSILILGFSLVKERRYKQLSISSIIIGTVGFVLFYFIATNVNSEFRGIYQRLFLLNFTAWLIMTSLMKLKSHEKHD